MSQRSTRSTATSIHPFVQYAKVTLLEISPCQGPTVKRSGVAYSCSYALLAEAMKRSNWLRWFPQNSRSKNKKRSPKSGSLAGLSFPFLKEDALEMVMTRQVEEESKRIHTRHKSIFLCPRLVWEGHPSNQMTPDSLQGLGQLSVPVDTTTQFTPRHAFDFQHLDGIYVCLFLSFGFKSWPSAVKNFTSRVQITLFNISFSTSSVWQSGKGLAKVERRECCRKKTSNEDWYKCESTGLVALLAKPASTAEATSTATCYNSRCFSFCWRKRITGYVAR